MDGEQIDLEEHIAEKTGKPGPGSTRMGETDLHKQIRAERKRVKAKIVTKLRALAASIEEDE
jgi:hypothetical protein